MYVCMCVCMYVRIRKRKISLHRLSLSLSLSLPLSLFLSIQQVQRKKKSSYTNPKVVIRGQQYSSKTVVQKEQEGKRAKQKKNRTTFLSPLNSPATFRSVHSIVHKKQLAEKNKQEIKKKNNRRQRRALVALQSTRFQ